MGFMSDIEMRQQTEPFWREKIGAEIENWVDDFEQDSVQQFIVTICSNIARGNMASESPTNAHLLLFELIDKNCQISATPLMAVLKLHTPSEWGNCLACSGNTNETVVAYPCPTVKAIKLNLK